MKEFQDEAHATVSLPRVVGMDPAPGRHRSFFAEQCSRLLWDASIHCECKSPFHDWSHSVLEVGLAFLPMDLPHAGLTDLLAGRSSGFSRQTEALRLQ